MAALALTACPGSAATPEQGSGATIAISGRVVDFQSCFTSAGCRGSMDMEVVAFYDGTLVSNTTKPDGFFTMPNVPRGGVYYLMVVDATGDGRFLTTLQAHPVVAEGGDVADVKIYAVSAQSALFRAIEEDLGASLGSDGIYIGQAVKNDPDKGLLAYSDAVVTVSPSANIRYVKNNLDLDPDPQPGDETFYDAGWGATGPLGQFVVTADGERTYHVIMPSSSSDSFQPAFVPLGKGYVTVGLHYTK